MGKGKSVKIHRIPFHSSIDLFINLTSPIGYHCMLDSMLGTRNIGKNELHFLPLSMS